MRNWIHGLGSRVHTWEVQLTPGTGPGPFVAQGLWLRSSPPGRKGRSPWVQSNMEDSPEVALQPRGNIALQGCAGGVVPCDQQSKRRGTGGVRMERQLPRGTESFSNHPQPVSSPQHQPGFDKTRPSGSSPSTLAGNHCVQSEDRGHLLV